MQKPGVYYCLTMSFKQKLSIALVVAIFASLIFGILYSYQYQKAHPEKLVALNDDGTNPYRTDAAAIERGKKTFEGICAACHKVDMTGLVGPNLTDATWLHGSTDKELYAIVMNGVPQDKLKQNPPKGPMPAHKNSLGSAKVLEVLAYVASKNPTLKAK